MKRFICILLGISLSFFVACREEKLTVGVMADLDSLPVAYAYQKGYLPENMELMLFTSAPLRDSALISRNLVGCVSDLLSAVQLADSGISIRVPISTGGSYALVENSSTRRTVAVSSGTVIEYMCDTMQTEYKKTVITSMSERCTMLTKKKIKAAVLPEPFAAYAVEQGCKYVARNSETKAAVMVFYRGFTKTGAYEEFCAGYNRAVKEIAQGADLTDSMHLLGFPPIDAAGLNLQYSAAAPPDRQSFDSITDYMRTHLKYKGKINYESICY